MLSICRHNSVKYKSRIKGEQMMVEHMNEVQSPGYYVTHYRQRVTVLQMLGIETMLLTVTFQETSRRSRLVTSVPVSLWRTGPPDSPPFVAPRGQNCASGRVSSITLSTLWWAWSCTPTSGRSLPLWLCMVTLRSEVCCQPKYEQKSAAAGF